MKAINASSWSLALRQGDGGALRHSHLLSKWQLHAVRIAVLHVIGLAEAVLTSQSALSAADDQLEGIDGTVREVAGLFSAE